MRNSVDFAMGVMTITMIAAWGCIGAMVADWCDLPTAPMVFAYAFLGMLCVIHSQRKVD